MYNKYMAISPKCDKCSNELVEFGAILLGLPDNENMVRKFHICIACYEQIRSTLE